MDHIQIVNTFLGISLNIKTCYLKFHCKSSQTENILPKRSILLTFELGIFKNLFTFIIAFLCSFLEFMYTH